MHWPMSGPTEDAPKQAGLAKADHGTKTGLWWRNRGAQAGWRRRGHESWRRGRISKVKLGMGQKDYQQLGACTEFRIAVLVRVITVSTVE